ncbi:MAG TPA: MBL fold metallo-hydrolase [Geobacteraceae bacterium]|nr:MBL fold metallo-hydrolase [Geobacteraceae bacterium]
MTKPHRRLPFRYLEPAVFGGLLDDPLLFLRIRPERRALLFDCGQIVHLAKRVVKPLIAVFISHAHMDHIMGVPTLVRHHHASPRPLDLFGPPGIIDRIEHLLLGFDWNLCEPTWFTLRVHEIHEGMIRQSHFPGPDCFVRRDMGEEPRHDRVIWSSRYVRVAAEILDHKLPVLAFRIEERPPFSVDGEKLAAMGMKTGDWLRDLKTRAWKGETGEPVVPLLHDGTAGPPLKAESQQALCAALQKEHHGAAIGYLTDIGWTTDNVARLERFFPGLALLCSECTFLAADQDKARVSHHLCSSDLNSLTRTLIPQYLLPVHLSKSYLQRTVDLYEELVPPAGTTLLRLPKHIVPPPLQENDVRKWLKP